MDEILRVLYVDDDPDLLDIGRLFLEESGDFTVSTVIRASDAIRLLERERFDAIISDYQMPEMDGIQFLIEVRTRFGPIPFVLFTGRGREEVVIQAINSGADFYLQKGGDPSAQFAELAHKVRSAALRKRAEDSLRQSEEKYRHLIEHSNEAIVVAQDGMLQLVNQRAVELTGFPRPKLLSMEFSAVIYPDDRAMVVERHNKRLKGEEAPSRYSFRLSPPDGSIRWAELSVTPIDWNGRPASLNFLTDITERNQAERALRESEEKYRSLTSQVHDGIYIYQGNRFVYTNTRVSEITGYSNEELLSMQFIELAHPDDQAYIKDIAERRWRREPVPDMYECRIIQKNGEVRNLELVVSTIPYQNGIAALGVARDITDRKRAEDALRKSNALLKRAEEVGGFGSWEISLNEKTVTASEGARILYGLPGTQWTLEEVQKIPLPEYRPLLDTVFGDLVTGKSSYHTEFKIRRLSDGAVLDIQSYAEYDPVNNVVFGVIHDITGRKATEDALRQSDEFNRNLVNNLPDYLLIYDQLGNILYTNPLFSTKFGYTPDEALGSPVIGHIAPGDRHQIRTLMEQRIAEINIPPYEVSILKKDGSLVPVIVKGTHITFRNRDAVLVLMNDISDLKQAEDALRDANKKLTLLSGITRHDINNQLTVLRGYLAILENKQPDHALCEYFQKVATATDRISAMIRFTSEYESIGVHAPAWQNFCALLGTVAKEVLPGKAIIKNDLPSGAEVFADPLIVKVFFNLVDNAVRYGGKITIIRFSAEERNGDHIIVCEDDGIGVPGDEKEKIFERGFGKNTGLGLALSREILSITGITICEKGEPGKGARFEMAVPKGAWRFAKEPE
ncbi:MAG: PAS domain S-box protein [Methanomicrobiales archaeon]